MTGRLEPRWIDSHCHIYDDRTPGGANAALDAARQAGVEGFVVVGCDRASSLSAIAAAQSHDDVVATVGLHPHDARHGVDSIRDLIDEANIVAIGEAGLDYHYDNSPRDEQRAAFEEQIAIANERDLPLVIHTRDAWDDTFDILDAVGVPRRTVFHCFTGGPNELERCLARDTYVSFSGIVTFPSAVDLQAAALACPLDRMLVETDSPYLAPVPFRGKPNQPAHVATVGTAIADLRNESVISVAAATSANTRSVFGLT